LRRNGANMDEVAVPRNGDEARRNLSETQAAELDAKLVLILANHIGDLDVLREAIALAKRSR